MPPGSSCLALHKMAIRSSLDGFNSDLAVFNIGLDTFVTRELILDSSFAGLSDIEFRIYGFDGDGQWTVDDFVIQFAPADLDDDNVADTDDNCTLSPNTDQRDTDGDNFGNVCDADLNNDCDVNVIDLGLFRGVFFTTDADADFNGDGIVNIIDLGILRQRFFVRPGPSGLPNECPP